MAVIPPKATAAITDKPRGPTPAEKFKIRQFLDGSYDEQMKGYIEPGMTDDRASRELNVPLSWVRDLRELAYGPIECDVELLECRQEMDKLMKMTLAMNERLKRLETARRG